MERAQENKSIYDLLRELADIQFNKAKVSSAEFAKKGTKLIANKVNDMRECILENADEYKQKIEFVEGTKTIKNAIEANILRNYELSLNSAKREYEAMYNGIAKEKGNLEIIENTAIMRQDYYGKLLEEEKKKPEYIRGEELKKQIKEALDNGEDIKQIKDLVEELDTVSKAHHVKEYEKEYNYNLMTRKRVEEQRKKWDKILDGLHDEERKAIEIIAGKKENLLKTTDEKYLAVTGKENWFKRMFGKIANIFLANKRYTDNVIKVLSDKAENTVERLIPNLNKSNRERMEEIRRLNEEFTKQINEQLRKYRVYRDYGEQQEERETDSSQRETPSDIRSKKMLDITKEEEVAIGGKKEEVKEEVKEEIKEDQKKEAEEKAKEEVKVEPIVEPEERPEETKKESNKGTEDKIKFKQNERINPWKVVGMGRTVGWRGVGKGKQLKIDNRKAGRPEKDEEEKSTDDGEER